MDRLRSEKWWVALSVIGEVVVGIAACFWLVACGIATELQSFWIDLTDAKKWERSRQDAEALGDLLQNVFAGLGFLTFLPIYLIFFRNYLKHYE